MAGKVTYQSLALLAKFGHRGRERSSESATSHIREPLATILENRQYKTKNDIKQVPDIRTN